MDIYVLNTLEIGIDSTNILKKHLNIKGVIGLSERRRIDKISGYCYLKPYCNDNDLGFVEIKNYSLKNDSDKAKLLGLNIDILIVSGWQRLIPSWLIDHCKICVIGSHGSVRGITSGRGRSPQNWALLLGKKEFFISIFEIDEGIDSGSVIATEKFVLSDLDDISTSYYKVCCLTSQMIIDSIKDGRITAQNTSRQEGEARYLPQRLPKDGEIDWSRTSKEIYDFIRALTKPYPGAFSYLGENKIAVWKGRPFEITDNSSSFECGEIVRMFHNGDFLVKTGDSFLLVDDHSEKHEGHERCLREGDILSSGEFRTQITDIIERHYDKYPELIITDDILDLVEYKNQQ